MTRASGLTTAAPREQHFDAPRAIHAQHGGYKPPARALEVTAPILFTCCVTPRASQPRQLCAVAVLLVVLLLGSPDAAGADSSVKKPAPQPNWAFRPLTHPVVPTPSNAAWSTNAIDRFLLAALDERGLSPAPPAEPRALARRLHFILTGLPPSPEDVEAFVRGFQQQPAASIQHRLDSLLASSHFGERFARHWQDVVRYADTHGTEHDAFLPHAWRYRDWLIRAFNADLPYDQFVREHIAGDLLEKPRWADGLNQSLLASAWWRLVEFNQTPVDVKGEEVIVVDSQIDAMSKAFLGLTVSCARCHDHKFDPISQRDFHGLYSILASTRTSMRVLDAPEKLHAHDAALAKLKEEIRAAMAATWLKQVEVWPAAIERGGPRSQYTNTPPAKTANVGVRAPLEVEATRWRTAFAAAETNKSSLAPLLRALRSGAAVPAAVPVEQPSRLPDASVPKTPRQSGRLADSGAGGTPAPLGLAFADFTTSADNGWFATGDFARHSPAGDFYLTTSGSNLLAAIYPAGRFSHLFSDKHPGTFRSPNFTITNKFIAALVTGNNNARVRLVIENFQGDSLLFTQITPKLNNRSVLHWVTLPIRDTWRGRRAYLELVPRDDFPYPGIVKDAGKLPTDGRSAAGIAKVVFHDGEKPPEPPAGPGELAGARTPTSAAGVVGEAAAADVGVRAQVFVQATRAAIAAWANSRCDDAQANFLNALLGLGLLENTAAPAGDLQSPSGAAVPMPSGGFKPPAALAELLANYRELEARVPIPTRVVGVSDEAPPFETPFFPRGDHLNPGAPVPRQFLSAFASTPYQSRTSGRRELAEDVLRNPLTARVMVNRLWHHAFGAGLVRSVDNLGKLAEEPSHPELLDWLAHELIAQGWSVKAMLRLMLTSRAFALSTETSPDAAERDPENRLLSHAPLRRLDAESLRDTILAVSGRLDRTPFGPGVPVTIPPSQRDDYTPVDGPLDGRARRSIYLEVRRNHPSPFLFAFDQPKPAAPAGRREATNVPTQSLTLLNDKFVLEQAGHAAVRALAQPGDASARIRWLYANGLSRPATEVEATRAAAFLAQQAAALGDEQRAWEHVAHSVFNLKEFLYLR